jgi:NAD(P)-dependent dehydrogenase (short-subunit alcohol dehydrogenase family)
MNFNYDFNGKTALVTGGTSGIGLAVTQAFHRAGAKVFAVGVGTAEIAAARANEQLSGVQIAELDVTNAQAVETLVSSIPRLDYVVTCAGIIKRGVEHDPIEFAKVLDVNLNGTMRVCAAARSKLAVSRGAIVMIGSVMSFFGGPAQPAYSASKGAIRNLCMSLGAAYAPEGIRVNAVAPGWVITQLSKGARDNEERFAQINARIPMARWADTSEIADPILFLCSDAARYMTGTVMAVDGGYMSVG